MTEASQQSPGWGRQVFGVLVRRRTWAALLYLIVSFPIAVATWVAAVTLIAVGGGLAITVVGIPLLVVTMYLWCFTADLERLLSNKLLGTTIRPLPFRQEAGLKWWGRLRARLKNPYTWRALLYVLIVRFPMALAGFVLVVSQFEASLAMLATPFEHAVTSPERPDWWPFSPLVESVAAIPFGLALVLISFHLIRLAGWIWAKINTAILQSPAVESEDLEAPLDRAAIAAVTWPGMVFRRGAGAARIRTIQSRVWTVHFALYLFVMLILLVINALTTPGTWWVLWPAWGWGIPLAVHTGYLLFGHLGGHAFGFGMVNAGLFMIDATLVAESTWFFWPLLGWAIALGIHAYLYFGFSPVRSDGLTLIEPLSSEEQR